MRSFADFLSSTQEDPEMVAVIESNDLIGVLLYKSFSSLVYESNARLISFLLEPITLIKILDLILADDSELGDEVLIRAAEKANDIFLTSKMKIIDSLTRHDYLLERLFAPLQPRAPDGSFPEPPHARACQGFLRIITIITRRCISDAPLENLVSFLEMRPRMLAAWIANLASFELAEALASLVEFSDDRPMHVTFDISALLVSEPVRFMEMLVRTFVADKCSATTREHIAFLFAAVMKRPLVCLRAAALRTLPVYAAHALAHSATDHRLLRAGGEVVCAGLRAMLEAELRACEGAAPDAEPSESDEFSCDAADSCGGREDSPGPRDPSSRDDLADDEKRAIFGAILDSIAALGGHLEALVASRRGVLVESPGAGADEPQVVPTEPAEPRVPAREASDPSEPAPAPSADAESSTASNGAPEPAEPLNAAPRLPAPQPLPFIVPPPSIGLFGIRTLALVSELARLVSFSFDVVAALSSETQMQALMASEVEAVPIDPHRLLVPLDGAYVIPEISALHILSRLHAARVVPALLELCALFPESAHCHNALLAVLAQHLRMRDALPALSIAPFSPAFFASLRAAVDAESTADSEASAFASFTARSSLGSHVATIARTLLYAASGAGLVCDEDGNVVPVLQERSAAEAPTLDMLERARAAPGDVSPSFLRFRALTDILLASADFRAVSAAALQPERERGAHFDTPTVLRNIKLRELEAMLAADGADASPEGAPGGGADDFLNFSDGSDEGLFAALDEDGEAGAPAPEADWEKAFEANADDFAAETPDDVFEFDAAAFDAQAEPAFAAWEGADTWDAFDGGAESPFEVQHEAPDAQDAPAAE
eukprot:gnl/Chilomastix_cuspidata/137.p1 GENE.gnl/Chilomastix_cuspidata/137~~gnl/Chilomastix_cuspidata/137.p1  ORF type:complete len:836 (-),score=453.32 gnl/Chilomastix_cuspidata/137:432-2939(-)